MVIKAFRSIKTLIAGRGVQLVTDNTTFMYYINKQGGTHCLSLLYLAFVLWEWCYARRVFGCSACLNTGQCSSRLTQQMALPQSRMGPQSIHLSTTLPKWGTPNIDIFAFPMNSKCRMFCMRAGKGAHSLGYAFMIRWSPDLMYLFPPIHLLFRRIVKLYQDQSDVILIAHGGHDNHGSPLCRPW